MPIEPFPHLSSLSFEKDRTLKKDSNPSKNTINDAEKNQINSGGEP